MMDNVLVRSASGKDIPILLGLLYDLGRPKPQKDSDVEIFRKLVTKYVKDSDKIILVAELDDMKNRRYGKCNVFAKTKPTYFGDVYSRINCP